MKNWRSYLPFLFKKKEGDSSLRETIEELIEEEEIEESEDEAS